MEKSATVDRYLFGTALVLGAVAVFWIGFVFVESGVLALSLIAVIGCVYGIGGAELLKFRHATSTLSKALCGANEKVENIDEWLLTIDPSLRNAVRRRIEGGQVGLPAPILTPYLVGLLVMLGLLGTFVGMVDTLRGAVIAIEGTTELQAIRDGLAAPIKGLGLAFGTSVAGVATSAMLGFMSTLCRRRRILETRALDSKISAVFQGFSLAYRQQEIFEALEGQTRALPAVVEKLDAMAGQLGRMGDTLVESQDRYHTSVKDNFFQLSDSMDRTFRKNLTERMHLVEKAIKPLVEQTLAGITRQAHEVHKRLTSTTKETIESSSRLFVAQSEEIAQSWKLGLEAQKQSIDIMIEQVGTSLRSFEDTGHRMTENMIQAYDGTFSSWMERTDASDNKRLDRWAAAIEKSQNEAAQHLAKISRILTDELEQVADKHHALFGAASQELISMISSLTTEWQKIEDDTNSRQMEISEALKLTVSDLSAATRKACVQLQDESSRMVQSSRELIQSRARTEKEWLAGHHGRMDALGTSLKDELGTLRDDEDRRGQAALERLEKLESVVVSNLAALGKALEEPMARLMEKASEAPRAAVDVIEQLRQEASGRIQRDNQLFEEHRRAIEAFDTLSTALTHKAAEQRKTIEQLATESKAIMEDVGLRFGDQVGEKISILREVVDTVAGSAVDMASLGEAFGSAVDLFHSSNGELIENLNRIEAALEKANHRSDDQLGYYVAQAKDMIDHSILSQKEIVNALRQLNHPNTPQREVDRWKD